MSGVAGGEDQRVGGGGIVTVKGLFVCIRRMEVHEESMGG